MKTIPYDAFEEYRCRNGLTQKEMAELIGIEMMTYRVNVILRKVRKPHGTTFYRFCRFVDEHREELGLSEEMMET